MWILKQFPAYRTGYPAGLSFIGPFVPAIFSRANNRDPYRCHYNLPSQRVSAFLPPCKRHFVPSNDGTSPCSQSLTRGRNGYSSVLIFSVNFHEPLGSRKNDPVYAQTESLTEALTEAQTESQTESLTESPTEAPTEAHSFNRVICSSVIFSGGLIWNG